MSLPEPAQEPTTKPAPRLESQPSTGHTLIVFLSPAVICLVLGVIAARTDVMSIAVILIGVAIVGSLVAGIWTGRRLAVRFASSPSSVPLLAAGLSVVCVVASAALCFGGCFAGLTSRGM